MLGTIIAVAIGVALGLTIYHNPEIITAPIEGIIKFITWPIRYLTGTTEAQREARNKKREEEREKEYQAALAKGDKNAKISKDCYFLMKTAKEREKEEKKKQTKINKYGANISDEEVERIERIKKQKAEYEALPQEEKDKIKKKKKKRLDNYYLCSSISIYYILITYTYS